MDPRYFAQPAMRGGTRGLSGRRFRRPVDPPFRFLQQPCGVNVPAGFEGDCIHAQAELEMTVGITIVMAYFFIESLANAIDTVQAGACQQNAEEIRRHAAHKV